MKFLNKRLFASTSIIMALLALLALQGCGSEKQPDKQVGSSQQELTGTNPGGGTSTEEREPPFYLPAVGTSVTVEGRTYIFKGHDWETDDPEYRGEVDVYGPTYGGDQWMVAQIDTIGGEERVDRSTHHMLSFDLANFADPNGRDTELIDIYWATPEEPVRCFFMHVFGKAK